MPAFDRTPDFRDAIREKERATPDVKRRRTTKNPGKDGERDAHVLLGKEYIAEAYTIVCQRY